VSGLNVTTLIARRLAHDTALMAAHVVLRGFVAVFSITETAIREIWQILARFVDARFEGKNFYHLSIRQQKVNTNQIGVFNT